MAVELATGYVTIIPSLQGFGKRMADELDGALPAAAKKAGEDAGESAAGGFGTKFKLGMAVVGAAAGAAVASSFSKALEGGAAEDKFAAQLGLTPKAAQELGGVAGNLYAQAYGASVADTSEAVRSVLQSGLVMEDIEAPDLEALTAKALDLAAAFDLDVNQAVNTAGQLMRTGLASNADNAFDILTRGFQEGGDKAGDLLDTFNEYGTQFRKLGIDGKQATGLLTQGLRAGARDADIVADAFKEFSIRAIDGSELTAESFWKLGLSGKQMSADIAKGGPKANKALEVTLDRLREVEDPVKRAQIAVGLFGTQAEDMGDALYELDLGTATQGFDNLEGAADRLGSTLNDNAATKIEAFKRQALGGLTDFIGDKVIPGVESLVAVFQDEGFSGVLETIGRRFSEAWPQIQTSLSNIARSLGEWIVTTAPEFGRQALALGQALIDWISPQIEPLLGKLGEFIGAGAAWMLETGLPALAEGAAKLVPALIDWVKNEAIPGLLEAIPELANAFADWVEDDGWEAFKNGGEKLGKAVWHGFQDSITSLFGDSWDFLSKGSLGLDLGPFSIGDTGGREHGGPVSAGMPYVVGEKRPELFVPSVDGVILPSVGGWGGSGDVFHIYNPVSEDPEQSIMAGIRRKVAMAGAG